MQNQQMCGILEKKLLVLYTNADSLLNKLEELNLVICDQESKPHVIAVTESKPKKYSGNIAASEFNVNGYNVFFEGEHDNSRGITVYVRDDLSGTQLDEGLPFHEHLLLKLNTDKQDGFILGVFYRSPTSPPENDKELFSMISYLNNKYYENLVIVGDFNFGNINWKGWTASGNDKNSDELFLDILRKNGLMQHVDKPTRQRGDDEPSILDLVISREYLSKLEYLSPLGKSDHAIIKLECEVTTSTKMQPVNYNYLRGNYDEMRVFLSRDWDKVLLPVSNSVDEMWSVFADLLSEAVECFVPKTFVGHKKHQSVQPFGYEIKESVRKKHRLWTRYIETRNPTVLHEYRKMRNKVKKEVHKIHQFKQESIARLTKSNPKHFWKYIKSKSSRNINVGELKSIDANGKEIWITEDQDKANELAKFYSDIFTIEVDEGPIVSLQTATVCDDIDLTEKLILEKLNSLDLSKSPGPDLLHPRVLYEVRHEIVYALKLIFERSLKDQQLPRDWKSSTITAIFKKRSRSNVGNYRPVSLTCVICKLLESLIRDHIMEYLLKNKLLSNRKYGFIKGRSTLLQLLNMLDKWTHDLESGGQIDAIYTDFEKAFDKVPHKRLLSKIRSYGFPRELTNWIEAFLLGRKYRVRVNEKFSDWYSVIGISQGSVLGPLLFILYINDLADMDTGDYRTDIIISVC